MNRNLTASLLIIAAGTVSAYSAEAGPIGNYTLSPSEGEVTEIQSIKIDFPDTGWRGIDMPNGTEITLTSDGGKVYKVAKVDCAYDTDATLWFAPEGSSTPTTITANGTYTLSIPEGAFHQFNKPEVKNTAITAVYSIVNGASEGPGAEDTNNVFGHYISEPTDGSSVGAFSQLTLTFDQLPNDGLDWPIDASAITLSSAEGSVSLAGNTPQLTGGYKTLIVGFGTPGTSMVEHQTITQAGTYTIIIPAGLLSVYGDSEKKNPEIKIEFSIDPTLNFSYKLSPDPSKVYATLPEIRIAADGDMVSVAPVAGSEGGTLSSGGVEYILTTSAGDNGVNYTLPTNAVLTAGEWKLRIAAGALQGVNSDGVSVTNRDEIIAVYTIKEPKTYSYTTTPTNGEEMKILTQFTVDIADKPKKVRVDSNAGVATLQAAEGESEAMNAKVSGTTVMLAPVSGAVVTPGTYTVNIPAGMIVTTDNDGLEAPLEAISSQFIIIESDGGDYSEGYFILNEGWFGHDAASLTFMPNNGAPYYRAFNHVNPERSLGITGGWITRYGDKIFTVSKQSGTNTSGIAGGILSSMDAETLAFDKELLTTPGGQPHAFAAASQSRGYLTTATGIYPIDIATLTAGEQIKFVESFKPNCGEIINYHGKIYAAVKDYDIVVIDPTDDSYQLVDLGPVAAPFVTADGSLWFATLIPDTPFVRVDTESMSGEYLTVDSEDVSARVATPWQTWRPSPLAADLTENVVYYATKDQATQIARVDLTTGEFNPAFITLPKSATGQLCLYGKGIAVDPTTGEIVLTVTELGYGTHYLVNDILRYDPVTGKQLEDKAISLEREYWFPSMTLWSGYEAPVINLRDLTIPTGAESVEVNLAQCTSLRLGNRHLIEYSLAPASRANVEIEQTQPGEFTVTLPSTESIELIATASFMGLTTTQPLALSVNTGVVDIKGVELHRDVYSATGILLKRNATEADIDALAPGLYIIGGRKVIVK